MSHLSCQQLCSMKHVASCLSPLALPTPSHLCPGKTLPGTPRLMLSFASCRVRSLLGPHQCQPLGVPTLREAGASTAILIAVRVSLHANTTTCPPKLTHPVLFDDQRLCLSGVTASLISSLPVPFSPSRFSLPLLLVKLSPSSRELQVWTASLGHR